MLYKLVANRLSKASRETLMNHVDGWAPIAAADRGQQVTNGALERLGLISPDRGHHVPPRRTIITADGREVLASVLAECAEMLIRAGYDLMDPVKDDGIILPWPLLRRPGASSALTSARSAPAPVTAHP